MMTDSTNIALIVNGVSLTTSAHNLEALLVELDRDNDMLATAVNGEFVPRGRRLETALQNGDRIELVAPMSGG